MDMRRAWLLIGVILAIACGLLWGASSKPAAGDAWKIKVRTDAEMIYLVDAQGTQVGSFTLPKTDPVVIEVQRKQ